MKALTWVLMPVVRGVAPCLRGGKALKCAGWDRIRFQIQAKVRCWACRSDPQCGGCTLAAAPCISCRPWSTKSHLARRRCDRFCSRLCLNVLKLCQLSLSQAQDCALPCARERSQPAIRARQEDNLIFCWCRRSQRCTLQPVTHCCHTSLPSAPTLVRSAYCTPLHPDARDCHILQQLLLLHVHTRCWPHGFRKLSHQCKLPCLFHRRRVPEV